MRVMNRITRSVKQEICGDTSQSTPGLDTNSKMLSKDKLFVRSVSWSDELFMFALWNDEVTRKMVRSKNAVSLTEHCQWFSERMKKRDSPTFIVFHGSDNTDRNKIGVVRFVDQGELRYDVGIIINPLYRNKGLAGHVLEISIKEMKRNLPDSILFAMYKKINKAVRKVFKKNNFYECNPCYDCEKVRGFDPKNELFCLYGADTH